MYDCVVLLFFRFRLVLVWSVSFCSSLSRYVPSHVLFHISLFLGSYSDSIILRPLSRRLALSRLACSWAECFGICLPVQFPYLATINLLQPQFHVAGEISLTLFCPFDQHSRHFFVVHVRLHELLKRDRERKKKTVDVGTRISDGARQA